MSCLVHNSVDCMGTAGLTRVCGQLLVSWEALLLRLGWLLAEAMGGDRAMMLSLSSRLAHMVAWWGPKKKSAMFLEVYTQNWHNVTFTVFSWPRQVPTSWS